MHTAGKVGEKYTKTGPTNNNRSSVKSWIGERYYKITYAQAIETKSRIKNSLSRTAIKGSLGGAIKAAINMRKVAFQYSLVRYTEAKAGKPRTSPKKASTFGITNSTTATHATTAHRITGLSLGHSQFLTIHCV